jgi:hypothetical protein
MVFLENEGQIQTNFVFLLIRTGIQCISGMEALYAAATAYVKLST